MFVEAGADPVDVPAMPKAVGASSAAPTKHACIPQGSFLCSAMASLAVADGSCLEASVQLRQAVRA